MIICIHAHDSNIQWIENTIGDKEIKHIVLEDLVRIKDSVKVKERVLQQLDKYSARDVSCFIITCTYFSAHLPETYAVPLIALDELLFRRIANEPKIQLVFTNEATIEGTLARYERFKNPNQRLTVHYIENAFDKVMLGEMSAYKRIVKEGLAQLNQEIPIVVGQLSMEIALEKDAISCLALLREEVVKYEQ